MSVVDVRVDVNERYAIEISRMLVCRGIERIIELDIMVVIGVVMVRCMGQRNESTMGRPMAVIG